MRPPCGMRAKFMSGPAKRTLPRILASFPITWPYALASVVSHVAASDISTQGRGRHGRNGSVGGTVRPAGHDEGRNSEMGDGRHDANRGRSASDAVHL